MAIILPCLFPCGCLGITTPYVENMPWMSMLYALKMATYALEIGMSIPWRWEPYALKISILFLGRGALGLESPVWLPWVPHSFQSPPTQWSQPGCGHFPSQRAQPGSYMKQNSLMLLILWGPAWYGAARRGAWGARTALGHRAAATLGPGGEECYQRCISQINRENGNERKLGKPWFDLWFAMILRFLPKVKDDPRVDAHILV